MQLRGKVAIVTGSARGIGKAYALRLAKEGAKVTVCDVLGCEPVAREIEAAGGEVLALKIDVTSEEDTVELVRKTVDRFGKVDILINNAAVFGGIERKPFEQILVEDWDRLMAVNLKGVFLCCKAVVPYMKKQGKGKIINIASTVAFTGLPWFLHYTTSKGGVVSMTRGLAEELGEFNINVNAVAPGMTQGDAIQGMMSAEDIKMGLSVQCLNRFIRPEDIAEAVVFLSSDGSDLITGQVLAVNAGEFLH